MKNKIRILFVGPFLGAHPGYVINSIEELVAKLDSNRYDTLLTSSAINRALRLSDMIRVVLTEINKRDIFLINIFSGLSFIGEDIASRLVAGFGKRLVMEIKGGAMPEFMERHPVWTRQVLSRADVLITPSQYLANKLNSKGFETRLVPLSIDIHKYRYRLREKPQPRLVWLRAFHKIYAPTSVIESIAKLVDRIPDINLIMIGPDKLDGSFREVNEAIERYKLASRVRIVGHINKSEVPQYLDQGDIFISSTLYESFGVSTVEAGANGLCIVSTNVGELPYIWRDGVDALLVPPNDPEAMAGGIARIIEEPGLGRELSIKARGVAERYDWSQVIPQWDQLFGEMMEINRNSH